MFSCKMIRSFLGPEAKIACTDGSADRPHRGWFIVRTCCSLLVALVNWIFRRRISLCRAPRNSIRAEACISGHPVAPLALCLVSREAGSHTQAHFIEWWRLWCSMYGARLCTCVGCHFRDILCNTEYSLRYSRARLGWSSLCRAGIRGNGVHTAQNNARVFMRSCYRLR